MSSCHRCQAWRPVSEGTRETGNAPYLFAIETVTVAHAATYVYDYANRLNGPSESSAQPRHTRTMPSARESPTGSDTGQVSEALGTARDRGLRSSAHADGDGNVPFWDALAYVDSQRLLNPEPLRSVRRARIAWLDRVRHRLRA